MPRHIRQRRGCGVSCWRRRRGGSSPEDLETDLREARARRDTATGELGEFESGLPDIAEAEERVHRDIAPVLRATVLAGDRRPVHRLPRQPRTESPGTDSISASPEPGPPSLIGLLIASVAGAPLDLRGQESVHADDERDTLLG